MQPQDAQPAMQAGEAIAEAAEASEMPSSGAFSALLEDHALQPQAAT